MGGIRQSRQSEPRRHEKSGQTHDILQLSGVAGLVGHNCTRHGKDLSAAGNNAQAPPNIPLVVSRRANDIWAMNEPSSPPFAAILDAIRFDADGLVPAIAQAHDTGEILMLAWMNRDAVVESLETGRVCYWSRSRQALWRKGETSGQLQSLVEMRLDCDGDALLLRVDQTGVACHTGRRSCFFRAARDGDWVEIAPVLISADQLYDSASG